MLTAQCDRLRKRAMELRQGRWSDGADDARLMDDAADVIENLRLRLTDIKEAETDRMGTVDTSERYDRKLNRMSDLMVEMYGFVRDVCELHPYVLANAHIPEWQITDHSTPAERYAEKLRELGIEVD